jgi:Serine-threonine protein kinase 19
MNKPFHPREDEIRKASGGKEKLSLAFLLLRDEWRGIIQKPKSRSSTVKDIFSPSSHPTLAIVCPVPVIFHSQLSQLLPSNFPIHHHLDKSIYFTIRTPVVQSIQNSAAYIYRSDLITYVKKQIIAFKSKDNLSFFSWQFFEFLISPPPSSDSFSSSEIEGRFQVWLSIRDDKDKGTHVDTSIPFTFTSVMTCLLQTGLLSRDKHELDNYSFGAPYAGLLYQYWNGGTTELVARIKRTQYSEMPLSKVLKMNLGKSQMTTLFHLRDAIGAGLLEQVETASGSFIRLRK